MLAQFQVLHMQFLAATVLGISNTIAGWLSHDYVHGRGKWADLMRPFGHICGGMSPTWWSDKHNVHHARTNEVYICTYTHAYTHIHEHNATDKTEQGCALSLRVEPLVRGVGLVRGLVRGLI